jgi:hypothetical protein
VILSLVTAMTFPVIWAVCANAVLLSVRLAAAIAMRIDFIFIMALIPAYRQTQAFMRAVR